MKLKFTEVPHQLQEEIASIKEKKDQVMHLFEVAMFTVGKDIEIGKINYDQPLPSQIELASLLVLNNYLRSQINIDFLREAYLFPKPDNYSQYFQSIVLHLQKREDILQIAREMEEAGDEGLNTAFLVFISTCNNGLIQRETPQSSFNNAEKFGVSNILWNHRNEDTRIAVIAALTQALLEEHVNSKDQGIRSE